jgi:hypothetical protein
MLAGKGKNAHRETRLHANKWARALNFLVNSHLKRFEQREKEEKKLAV